MQEGREVKGQDFEQHPTVFAYSCEQTMLIITILVILIVIITVILTILIYIWVHSICIIPPTDISV